MNGAMRINVDRRRFGILWLALALAVVGLAVGIGLANLPGTPVHVPVVARDQAAIAAERYAVTHGVSAGSQAAAPACRGPVVTDELDAIRRGIYPRGLAAVEFCARQADNARELDAIRRARSAQVGGAEGSWSIDSIDFYRQFARPGNAEFTPATDRIDIHGQH